MGIDPIKLEDYLKSVTQVKSHECFNQITGRRIKALIAVHLYGHPSQIDKIADICKRYHIELIEDCAESLGSFYRSKHTGSWGRCAILSFNGNKIITAGGGGALLTRDAKLAENLRHISTTAKLPHPWNTEHDQVGYNYRMPCINAALGMAQLKRIDSIRNAKRELANGYERLLQGVEGVRFITEPKHANSNYWLNTIVLDPSAQQSRDEILKQLVNNGFIARPAWHRMQALEHLKDVPAADLQVSKDLSQRIINLPSGVFV